MKTQVQWITKLHFPLDRELSFSYRIALELFMNMYYKYMHSKTTQDTHINWYSRTSIINRTLAYSKLKMAKMVCLIRTSQNNQSYSISTSDPHTKEAEGATVSAVSAKVLSTLTA